MPATTRNPTQIPIPGLTVQPPGRQTTKDAGAATGYTPICDDPRFQLSASAVHPARRKPGPPRLTDPNPQVLRFGAGAPGVTCRACAHLDRYREGGTWAKCALRLIGRQGFDGASTDHKAGWPACAKYETERE